MDHSTPVSFFSHPRNKLADLATEEDLPMRTFIQQKSFPEATRYIPGIVGHAILVLPRIPPPFSFFFLFPPLDHHACLSLFLFSAEKRVAVL